MAPAHPQIAVDTGAEAQDARAEVRSVSPPMVVGPDTPKDHFIVRDGVACAGTHLIIDLWDAHGLDDLDRVEGAMRQAVIDAGATLLHIHLHHFTPNGGISGVAVLAESHISIHTWPEKGYAALDVFMCGDAEPHRALDALKDAFNPGRVAVDDLRRGEVDHGQS